MSLSTLLCISQHDSSVCNLPSKPHSSLDAHTVYWQQITLSRVKGQYSGGKTQGSMCSGTVVSVSIHIVPAAASLYGAGLEGRRVSLQRRTSSINRKPSTLTDLFPSYDETRGKKQAAMLPGIKQPEALAMPLREATATAKSSEEVQQILM